MSFALRDVGRSWMGGWEIYVTSGKLMWPNSRHFLTVVRRQRLGPHLYTVDDPLRGAVFERTWMGYQLRHATIECL